MWKSAKWVAAREPIKLRKRAKYSAARTHRRGKGRAI